MREGFLEHIYREKCLKKGNIDESKRRFGRKI